MKNLLRYDKFYGIPIEPMKNDTLESFFKDYKTYLIDTDCSVRFKYAISLFELGISSVKNAARRKELNRTVIDKKSAFTIFF